MTTCPHCGAAYDASHRLTGDRVYHTCGQWFLVVHLGGGATELRVCEAPVSWPKERKAQSGKRKKE